MEMCIAIRTLMQRGRQVSVQAGAGVVYDSKPSREYQETVNKAKALFTAITEAECRASEGAALLPHGSVGLSRSGAKPRTQAKRTSTQAKRKGNRSRA